MLRKVDYMTPPTKNEIPGELWTRFNEPIYCERYLISTNGRIYSLLKNKFLKMYKNNGYFEIRIRIRKEELHKHFRINRVVAFAFLEKPKDKNMVNHKDGDKLNNKLDNLEWATGTENVQHSIDTGNTKIFGRKIAKINLNGIVEKEYFSTKEVAEEFNLNVSTIRKYILSEKLINDFLLIYLDEERVIMDKKGIEKIILENKEIPGFPNYYITKTGKIFSSKFNMWLKIYSNKKSNKYDSIGIYDENGIRTTHYIHYLVALTYIPNEKKLPYVNHLDNDKYNNSVENLIWCTEQENTRHYYDTVKPILGKKVCQIFDDLTFKEFNNANEASVELHIGAQYINDACCGNQKSAGGFIFCRPEDLEEKLKELETEKNSRNRKGKPVYQIHDNKIINCFYSSTEAEKETGGSRKGISNSCNGTGNTSGGFIWKFESDLDPTEKRRYFLENLDYLMSNMRNISLDIEVLHAEREKSLLKNEKECKEEISE